jgi:hypothetical protein
MDMSKPGAHLRNLLEEFRFKQKDQMQESSDHRLRSEIYQECAMKLERALEKEASQAKPGA